MTLVLHAAYSPGEVRVAAWTGNALADYAIWRPGQPDGVGDVHVGRVSARAPALAGCFVTLVDAEGFLPDSEGGAGCQVGTWLMLRVSRAAQGGKGPRLAALPAPLPAAPRLARLEFGPGPLLELAARYPDAEILLDDAALAASLRPKLGARLHPVARAWDAALADVAASLESPTITLAGGMRLTIETTRALTALDLDSSALAGGGGAKNATHLAANRAALPQIARQIRLRNLSGAILLDLAGLPARRRANLAPDLAAALAEDPLRPRLLGFTALGLAEIVRPRIRPPLAEMLAGPHAAALAGLRAAAGRIATDPSWRPALIVAPDVAYALETDQLALRQMAERAGGAVPITRAADFPPGAWQLGEP